MRPPEPPPPAPEPVPEPPAARSPEPTPEVKPKPRPPTVKQRLAEARRLREGNKAEQALDLYGRIAADDPENAEALAGRGLCYFDLEQYAPAEASLQEALRISPTQPDALLGLAETYRAQGRKAEAIGAFERYLAAHPEGDEAAVARNAINQLRE
jgi:tetratricopeptide (TPR) repeat protein